jgi:hypothetical protein
MIASASTSFWSPPEWTWDRHFHSAVEWLARSTSLIGKQHLHPTCCDIYAAGTRPPQAILVQMVIVSTTAYDDPNTGRIRIGGIRAGSMSEGRMSAGRQPGRAGHDPPPTRLHAAHRPRSPYARRTFQNVEKPFSTPVMSLR